MDLLLLSLIQCFTPRHFISVRIPSTILHLINGYLVGTTTLHPIFSLTSHLTSPHRHFLTLITPLMLSEWVSVEEFPWFPVPSSEGVMWLLVSAATTRNDDNYIWAPSNQDQSNNKHPVTFIFWHLGLFLHKIWCDLVLSFVHAGRAGVNFHSFF